MVTKYGIVHLYGGKDMRFWLQTSENLEELRQTAALLSEENDRFYAIAAVGVNDPLILDYVYVGGREYENAAGVKAVVDAVPA